MKSEIIDKIPGEFFTDLEVVKEKLSRIKAIIFDWDGVFHNGYKKSNKESSFSEADSMGINMLRFAYFLQKGVLPYTAIITGENNETAGYFARREHFDKVYMRSKNKIESLNSILKETGCKKEEVLFVFDDILDLSMAEVCGLRFMINREASFMLKAYCKEHNLCDYLTKYDGANHGIREVCELAISLLDNYDKVIGWRIAYSEEYRNYLSQRQAKKTEIVLS